MDPEVEVPITPPVPVGASAVRVKGPVPLPPTTIVVGFETAVAEGTCAFPLGIARILEAV